MSKTSPRTIAVKLTLLPEVVEEIERRACAEGPVELFQFGGVAGWVRKLIYRELGLDVPPARSVKAKLPLHLIEMKTWTTHEELIVRLMQRGRTACQTARYLNDMEIRPLPRSGRWYPEQIYRIVNQAIGKSLIEACSKV